jgi:hypothetical protein
MVMSRTRIATEALLISSWGIAVQDVVSAEQHRGEVPAGEYEATIIGRPVPRPAQVRFVLTRS